jgi:hypothetical protein
VKAGLALCSGLCRQLSKEFAEKLLHMKEFDTFKYR